MSAGHNLCLLLLGQRWREGITDTVENWVAGELRSDIQRRQYAVAENAKKMVFYRKKGENRREQIIARSVGLDTGRTAAIFTGRRTLTIFEQRRNDEASVAQTGKRA